MNNKTTKGKPIPNSGYFINDQIRAEQVRVITEDGKNVGVLSRRDALSMALESSVDLVQIGDTDDNSLVTAKLMDFGKFLYEKKKQQNEAKKHQKVIQIKEVKLRPHIGDQDYAIKINQAARFLTDGMRVKFTLQFRGRENAMVEDLGPRVFERIHKDLTARELGTLIDEKESRGGPLWSKIYYLKEK